MKNEPLNLETLQKIIDFQKKEKEFWDELKETKEDIGQPQEK
jgi:hypothetical protein